MSEYSDSEPIVVERRSGGGIGLFLLGVAVGAGLALLYAPQSGAETRQDLRRGARRMRRKARDLAAEAREAAGDVVRSSRDAASDFARSSKSAAGDFVRTTRAAARDAVGEARDAAGEARDALERRLARHGRAADDEEDTGV